MHFETKFQKKIKYTAFLGVLVSSALFPVNGYAENFRELYPQESWQNVVNTGTECTYKGYFSEKYQLLLGYNAFQNEVFLNIISPYTEFVPNTVYEADLYLDEDKTIRTTALAVTHQDLRITLGNSPDLYSFFDGVKEFSVGFDETLYVFHNEKHNIPVGKLQSCTPAVDAPPEKGSIFNRVVDTLNPFEDDAPEVEQAPLQQPVRISEAAKAADADADPVTIIPLDGESPVTVYNDYGNNNFAKQDPYALNYKPYTPEKPQAQKSSVYMTEPQQDEPAVETEIASVETFEDYSAPVSAESEEIQDFSPLEQQFYRKSASKAGFSDIPVAKPPPKRNSVIDIADLAEDQYPPELHKIIGHTDYANTNDQEELVESLLTQLALLEREKEALRQKVAEQPTALSVIRSCSSEKERIMGLKDQVQILQTETFDYKRQQEINEDLLKTCDVLQEEDLSNLEEDFDIEEAIRSDDNPPPPPPSEVSEEPEAQEEPVVSEESAEPDTQTTTPPPSSDDSASEAPEADEITEEPSSEE